MITRIHMALVAILSFLICAPGTLAFKHVNVTMVQIQDIHGNSLYVPDDRKPSLFTTNWGNCLGGSTVNLTRFDAAFYHDNLTVAFHFAGSSGLNNASLMMYIGVFAYGESRFDLIFNPCSANIRSLCPLNSSVPIEAAGLIPVSEQDLSGIPELAYGIPDFEGQAILRIFDNATEQEIACYSGVISNGNSFSHPTAVGTVLGIFTIIALLSSFATAVYGESISTMRLHYAHSLSVGVVFAVYQHIFFTGALSVNWPSVLVAWWSNFAWAGGMIHSSSMQSSINNLLGNNFGNTSEVGAAQSGSTQPTLGGGVDISAIYKRSSILRLEPFRWIQRRPRMEKVFERAIKSRAAAPADTLDPSYTWFGHKVEPGFPLPGNFSGFAGTLAEESILASNAFMTGFLWFIILFVILVASVIALKWALEGLIRIKWIKDGRLQFFRDHWMTYTGLLALRTCLIAFFMMMLLTVFEFTYSSTGGVKAIAAIVFIIFFFGIFGAAAYALWYKENVMAIGVRHQFEHKKVLGKVPWFGVKKIEPTVEVQPDPYQEALDSKAGATPFWKRMPSTGNVSTGTAPVTNIHDSEDYTVKFGWLAARFRRSRWWFFTVWIFYEFLRAVFYGGASGSARAQVYGLLVIEVIAFAFVIWARPFEGQRLNILVVYCLGFSKVATIALSAAFDVHFNLNRIITTVLGIVIIVIQGILTIITLVAIAVGAISSYMSISRSREEFYPKALHGVRERYFDHLDRAVNDLPKEPEPKKVKKEKKSSTVVVEEELKSGFEMVNVRRVGKIDEDDGDVMSHHNASNVSLTGRPIRPGTNTRDSFYTVPSTPARSRPTSVASFSNLPYGARPHRMSWSMREADTIAADREALENWNTVDISRVAQEDPSSKPRPGTKSPMHSRTASRTTTVPALNTSIPEDQPQISHDNLRVGGDISTRDMIGKVPAPTVRPRSNTHGSRHSRNSFGGSVAEASRSSDHLVVAGTSASHAADGRPSLNFRPAQALAPAQEVDE